MVDGEGMHKHEYDVPKRDCNERATSRACAPVDSEDMLTRARNIFFFFFFRLFHKPSIHNELTSVIIHRVKNVAGYPESSADVLLNPSLLDNLDLYGDGPVRAMEVRRRL